VTDTIWQSKEVWWSVKQQRGALRLRKIMGLRLRGVIGNFAISYTICLASSLSWEWFSIYNKY